MVRGEVGTLLELKQGMGLHLQMSWETPGASRVVVETRSGFLSRCDGDLWAQLNWMKGVKPPVKFGEGTRDCSLGSAGTKASCCEDRGVSWFFSNSSRRLGIPLQVPWGTQGASRVASGKSSLHSNCNGVRGIALSSCEENWASIQLKGNLKVFLKLWQEVWVPSIFNRDFRETLMLSLGSLESF